MSVASGLQELFAKRDLDALVDALAEDVVWQGIKASWVCHSRDDARQVMESFIAQGGTGDPEVIAEIGDRVVVDPHSDPPPDFAPQLHQVFTFRAGKIIRIDDFPDRRAALEAVGT